MPASLGGLQLDKRPSPRHYLQLRLQRASGGRGVGWRGGGVGRRGGGVVGRINTDV